MSPISGILKRHFGPFERYDIGLYAATFIAYYVTALFGLYVYYHSQTSPALIWPPVGIALAAMVYGGYRMWLPILLAQFFAFLVWSPQFYILGSVIAIAYTLQATLGLYVLRRFSFELQLETLRNTLILVFAAFFITMIEPAVATIAQAAVGTLTANPIVNFGRAWGGGLFSVLVIAPFAVTWYHVRRFPYTRAELIEVAAAFPLLIANNLFVFWTNYTQYVGIAIIFFLPAVLIWFALRLPARWLTLAIFLTSVIGLAGSIFAHPSPTPLNEQLLADQIYIGLIAAIFLIFVAVVEERRSAYRRLELAYEATSAADKAKNEFIAILAHELRNPLAPIVSSLELLRFEPQTPGARRTIDNAEEHTNMIRRLLDDLLDTARLAQKKFNLQKESVSLSDLMRQSASSVRDIVEGRRHKLSVVTPQSDLTLHADPVRIKQIMINLLNNAAKYTEPGGSIVIEAQRVGEQARLRVSDTGVGIAPEQQGTLFRAFKQLEGGTHTSPGLGIGLYLTKHLVEMHDGRIEMHSDGKGAGSTFTVYLPLPRQKELPLGNHKKKGASTVVARRVLVVDDNKPAADSIALLLARHNHQTEKAYSGAEALEKLGAFHPDVILLDIGMPGMDGYETAKKIRDSGWKGVLIAITGYGLPSDRTLSQAAGFDHHLVKPVSLDEVSGALASSH